MSRARCRQVCIDTAGNRLPDATVTVRSPGTSNSISDTIYAADTGASTLTNPLTTDSNGAVEFYLATPQRVDLFIQKVGYADTTISNVDVNPPPNHAHSGGADGSLVTATKLQTANAPASTGQIQIDGDDLKWWGASSGKIIKINRSYTDWAPTVTQSGAVAATVNEAKYKLAGDTVHLYATLTVTGSGSAGSRVVIGGIPIDAVPITTAAKILGLMSIGRESTGLNYPGVIRLSNNGTEWRLYGWGLADGWGVTPNFALGNGDVILINAWYHVQS